MTGHLRYFDTDDLIMSTAAYYLTANAGDFCQRLRRAWPELNENVRAYVQRLVESQFAREGVLRRLYLEPDWTLFGDDRDEWVAVRNLWAIKSEE
jgi:transposase InsO family protein